MTIRNIEAILAIGGIIGLCALSTGCGTGAQPKLRCQLDALEQLPKPLDTTSVRDAIELVSRLRACDQAPDAGR
jgi:hypothetical protein